MAMKPPMNPIYPTNNNSLHFYLVNDYSKSNDEKMQIRWIKWLQILVEIFHRDLKFWPGPDIRKCVAIYPKLSQMKILHRPIYFSRLELLDVFRCPLGPSSVSGPYRPDLFRPYPWIFSSKFPVLYALCPSNIKMTHFNFIFICLNVERTIPQITEVSITPFRQS